MTPTHHVLFISFLFSKSILRLWEAESSTHCFFFLRDHSEGFFCDVSFFSEGLFGSILPMFPRFSSHSRYVHGKHQKDQYSLVLFFSFLLFTYTISQINRKVRSLLRHSCNEVYSAAKAGGTGSFSACRWLSVLPGKQKNNKKARPWNTSTRHVDTQAFSQEISAETTTASGKSAGYAIWGRLLMLNSMD